MKRRIVIVGLALLVVGIGYLTWTLAGLPPIRYVLRYGFSPGCEPTGEIREFEGVTFVEIGPGIYRMGSTWMAEGGDRLGKLCKPFGLPWGKQPEPSDEMPVHWVEFRRGFWIATTEVTNAQYERFKADHDRSQYAPGDDDPVVEVSWEDAKSYCAWLAVKARRPIRLPSEAEWECACRAGNGREYSFGDDGADLGKHAWFAGNSVDRPHPVATMRPNRWGLHDLHGNVSEWCEDTWHDSYDDAPGDGSAWVDKGSPGRVGRGAGWGLPAGNCRSAVRFAYFPVARASDLGFRPAFTFSKN